jgi:hypothetical protein
VATAILLMAAHVRGAAGNCTCLQLACADAPATALAHARNRTPFAFTGMAYR